MYDPLERGQKVGYWTVSIDTGEKCSVMEERTTNWFDSSVGLLFGGLIGSFAALVSPDFVQWLSVIIFGILLFLMLLFLEETAFDRSLPGEWTSAVDAKTSGSDLESVLKLEPTPPSSRSVNPSLPWLNFYRTNTHGLKQTSMLETTLHVAKLSTYPNVAIPVIAYSWTWYLVSHSY
jgi:hypothetical protein